MSVRPVISRYLRRAVITVVLVAFSMGSVKLGQTPTYEATAHVLVGQRSPAQEKGNGKIQLIPLAPAPETLRAITQTMVHAIDSRPVAEETIRRLELQMDPAELSDNLTVEEVEATQFIALTYESTDPFKAKKIANTVGEVSSERTPPIRAVGSEFTATVWKPATLPKSPVSPHPLIDGVTGLVPLVLALMLGAWGFVAAPSIRAGEWIPRQRLATWYSDDSIIERVKEKKLLRAIGRRGKLTALRAAVDTSLSVAESRRILEELAFAGHLEVTVEHGKLLYGFWARD